MESVSGTRVTRPLQDHTATGTEVVMPNLDGKELKQVIDPDLAKAFTHPLRSHVWVTLFERGEVSPVEVA
ncbi:MAG TPA: hypothetical protein VH703_04895, partial [Solirubrobacterales bacterium]